MRREVVLTVGIMVPVCGLPGKVQLENIARNAFHGKVFIDAADVQRLRFQQHGVVGVVGDGAAAGQRGQLAATSATQRAAHCVGIAPAFRN
nr:hypothetical protein [Pseudomonas putida]